MSDNQVDILTSDQTVNLQDCRLPLQSFGVYGLFGLKNSGKTYQSFNMLDAYLEHGEKYKNTYDIMNYRNLNGLFTSIYYISPSEENDRTMNDLKYKYQNCKGLNKYSQGIQILDGQKDIILNTMEYIKQESIDLNNFCDDQKQILELLKTKDFIQTVRNLKYKIRFGGQLNVSLSDKMMYAYLQQFCQQLEKYKIQYSDCRFETDKKTLNNLEQLEEILEIKFQVQNYYPCFMRFPKTALIMDDLSGSSLITNTVENGLFKFLNQARHFGLFYTSINVHSLSTLYNSFKVCLTGILLFGGLNLEKVEQLFDVISKIDSQYFGKKEFVELYKDVEGYNLSYQDRIDQKIQYDFLYVIITPQVQIYYNFDTKLL